LILHRRSWCRACVGSGSTVGQTQHASPNHAHPRARISESRAPPPNHAHLRIRIPASYASPHTHPRTRIPAYASPQTKYAYAHPHSKPKSSRLRAHVEVALRRDFIRSGFPRPPSRTALSRCARVGSGKQPRLCTTSRRRASRALSVRCSGAPETRPLSR